MNIMNLYDVKVTKEFLLSDVSEKKIEKQQKYIEKYGKIDKPIVLNNGVLVDGYTRFIAAYLMGLHDIPYVESIKLN